MFHEQNINWLFNGGCVSSNSSECRKISRRLYVFLFSTSLRQRTSCWQFIDIWLLIFKLQVNFLWKTPHLSELFVIIRRSEEYCSLCLDHHNRERITWAHLHVNSPKSTHGWNYKNSLMSQSFRDLSSWVVGNLWYTSVVRYQGMIVIPALALCWLRYMDTSVQPENSLKNLSSIP